MCTEWADSLQRCRGQGVRNAHVISYKKSACCFLHFPHVFHLFDSLILEAIAKRNERMGPAYRAGNKSYVKIFGAKVFFISCSKPQIRVVSIEPVCFRTGYFPVLTATFRAHTNRKSFEPAHAICKCESSHRNAKVFVLHEGAIANQC